MKVKDFLSLASRDSNVDNVTLQVGSFSVTFEFRQIKGALVALAPILETEVKEWGISAEEDYEFATAPGDETTIITLKIYA